MSSLTDSVESEWSIVSNKDFPEEEDADLNLKDSSTSEPQENGETSKEGSDEVDGSRGSPKATLVAGASNGTLIGNDDEAARASDATTMTSFIQDKGETGHDSASDSSDVDVLDEMAEEDISNHAAHFPDWPMPRGKCSVGVMTEFIPGSAVVPKEECQKCNDQGLKPLDFLSDYIITPEREFHPEYHVFGILLLAIVLFTLTCFTVQFVFNYNAASTEDQLGDIENTILACLGRHHVDALNKGDFLEFEVCTDEEGDYTKHIRNKLLNRKMITFLLDAQVKLQEGEELPVVKWTSGPNKGKAIDIPLIIRHLEYKGLMVRMVYDDTPQKLNDIREKQIAKSAFREVIREEEIVKQMQEAIENLAIRNEQLLQQSLKDGGVQKSSHVEPNEDKKPENIEVDAEKEEDDLSQEGSTLQGGESYRSLVQEMQEKIQILLEDNENLHKEISSIYSSGKTPTTGYCKEPDADIPPLNEQEYDFEEVDEEMEKIKEEQLDSVLTLAKQIESIHESLSEELSKLKDWNSVIREMTNSLKDHKMEGKSKVYEWSWEAVKKNIQDIISDVQKDVTSKFNAFNELNMTEFLREYVADEKRNAESLLNLVNYYFKAAKDRTQEMFSSVDPEDTGETTDSVWNVWDGLHDKWTGLKVGIKRIVKDMQQEAGTTGKTAKEPSGPPPHDNPKQAGDAGPIRDSRNDWLFRRAALRAKNRQPANENKVNWFLRRKKLRDEKTR